MHNELNPIELLLSGHSGIVWSLVRSLAFWQGLSAEVYIRRGLNKTTNRENPGERASSRLQLGDFVTRSRVHPGSLVSSKLVTRRGK